MSSPTQPYSGPTGPLDPAASILLADLEASFGELTLADEDGPLGSQRGGPPREVLEEIAAADAALARLAQSGQTVHFSECGDGSTRIELQSLDGITLRTLSAAEAIALACGGPGTDGAW